MLVLDEIINIDQIRSIVNSFSGERQLMELKHYLIQYHDDLNELGYDSANLAWQIYSKGIILNEKAD